MNRNPNVRNGATLNVRLLVKSLAVFILFMLASPALAQFTVPSIFPGGTAEVTDNSAWIYAEINAGGQQATVVFEYTLDPAFLVGITSSEAQVTSNNTVMLLVGTAISGLLPSTKYYFRAKATNAQGPTTVGPILDFTTFYQTFVIETDDDVPGNPTQKIGVINPGLLGAGGVVVLPALAKRGIGGTSSLNEKLLLSGPTATIAIAARQGSPFGANSVLGVFQNVTMNNGGSLHFHDQIVGAPSNADRGLFLKNASENLINREGDAVPPGGVFYVDNTNRSPIASNGTVFFGSTLSPITSGRRAVGFSNGVTSGILARDTLIGAADGTVTGNLTISTLVASSTGAAFVSPLSNPNPALSGNEGILAGNTSGALTVIARKQDKPPGLNPIIYGSFKSVSASTDVNFSFAADLFLKNVVNATDDQILVSSLGGVQSVVAREGSAVPGIVGGIWDRFDRHFVTNAGDILFQAFLRIGGPVTTANDGVLVRWSAGSIEILAREGSRALGQRSATYRVFTNFSVNGNGNYMFQSTLSDARTVLIADSGVGQRMAAAAGGRVYLNRLTELDPVIFSIATNSDLTNLANGTGGYGTVIDDQGAVFAVAYVGAGRYIAFVF
jgi:hypothetical protein